MFVGSCFITLKENPRVYPWIKIFSYGLPTLVCLLHPAESEKLKLLLDGAYDLFVIPDMSKIKQIMN